jgi:hypothetical protein
MKRLLAFLLFAAPVLASPPHKPPPLFPFYVTGNSLLGDLPQGVPPTQFCVDIQAQCVVMAGYYNGIPLAVRALSDGTLATSGGTPQQWCTTCIPVAGSYNGNPVAIKVDAEGNVQIVGIAGVASLNGLVGAVTISAGANITLTPSGNNIAISSTGGGGGTPGGTNSELQYNAFGFFAGAAGLQTDGTSLSIKGPSPWRDVRAFGAVGNGTTDDGPAFNAAIAAAEADPGGTVYVSWSAHPYLINTCLTFASTHTNWLTVLFAGNVNWGSGCPTQNIHSFFVYWKGIGSGQGAAADNLAAKATLTSNSSATFIDIAGESITMENMDIRCTNVALTAPCEMWDDVPGGGSVYISNLNVNVATVGTGSSLQAGNANSFGYGGIINGGSYNTATGGGTCTASIKFHGGGNTQINGAKIFNCGIYIEYPASAPSPPAGNFKISNILAEGLITPFLTLNSGTVSGAGIEQIDVDFGTLADNVGTAPLIKTLGTNGISNVTLDNSVGGSPVALDQSANPISGLFILGLYDYLGVPVESDIWQAGSVGHLFSGGQSYFWGAAATSVALNTLRGGVGVCQGSGSGTGTDAPFHVSDCTNGGNGINYETLPGGSFDSTNSLVAREDSAATNGYHTFESPNGGSFNFMFCRVTGGCPGYILYNHTNDAFGITAGSQSEMYIGDSLGGVAILRGFQFLNGGSNALTFGGSFSAARSQSFQDASGTIALTSAIPACAPSNCTTNVYTGTIAMGTPTISANTCTEVTQTATGVLTSDAMKIDTGGIALQTITGFLPTSQPLTITYRIVSTNTIGVSYCNYTASPVTVGSLTFVVHVTR